MQVLLPTVLKQPLAADSEWATGIKNFRGVCITAHYVMYSFAESTGF